MTLLLACPACDLRYAGPTSETSFETCARCGVRFCRCCHPDAVLDSDLFRTHGDILETAAFVASLP